MAFLTLQVYSSHYPSLVPRPPPEHDVQPRAQAPTRARCAASCPGPHPSTVCSLVPRPPPEHGVQPRAQAPTRARCAASCPGPHPSTVCSLVPRPPPEHDVQPCAQAPTRARCENKLWSDWAKRHGWSAWQHAHTVVIYSKGC